jgi:hypothetical protein
VGFLCFLEFPVLPVSSWILPNEDTPDPVHWQAHLSRSPLGQIGLSSSFQSLTPEIALPPS